MTRSQLFDFIDQKYLGWFPFNDFNQIQKQCLPVILESDQNVVITAPTGSGKTTMFEFAMIRAWQCNNQIKNKFVYICPLRALCAEKACMWKEKFKLLQKSVIEITGNDSPSEAEVESADLIVTTPEKWDYMTRTSTSRNLIKSITLILIDEVHILNDVRGATMEAIVCRMRLIKESIRIVAVSATIPNINHLGLWLMDWRTKTPAKVLSFPDSMRPVPLKSHVLAYQMNEKNAFTFEYSLNFKLPDLIRKYSQDKPTLIFCSTRKSTEKSAEFLVNSNIANEGDACKVSESEKIENLKLNEYIQRGIGFHHAGLTQNDRELVESLYKSNRIKILCSTSTLAIGVNLPAQLVIIKSTLQYTETGYSEYSDLDIRQMIGRAGRAGYDTHGVALILTSTTTEHLYNSISEGKIELESRLTSQIFLEYLSIEICNENIKSLEDVRMWTSFSFLYTRMKLDPKKYFSIDGSSFESQVDKSLRMFLEELKNQEVIIEVNEGYGYKPTVLGKSLTRNYIKVESLKHIYRSSLLTDLECSNLVKIICNNPEVICRAELRPGDKVLLHRIAGNQNLLFPLPKSKNNIIEKWMKPYFFIQIALQSELAEFEGKLTPIQRSDQSIFLEQAKKLLKFIIEYSILKNVGIIARNALELLSSFTGLSWHSNSKLLEQFPSIGKISATSLFNAKIRSIISLYTEDDSRIELLVKRNPPFGNNLKKFIRQNVPIPKLDCDIVDGKLHISFLIQNATLCPNSAIHLLVLAYKSKENANYVKKESAFSIRLLLYEKFHSKYCKSDQERKVILPSDFASYSCSLMFEDWAGLNQNICYDLKDEAEEVKVNEKMSFDTKKNESELNMKENEKEKDIRIITEDFDEFNEFILDEVEVEEVEKDLMLHKSTSPLTSEHPEHNKSNTTITQVSTPTVQRKCKHSCKDRLSCAHSCCKFGIILSPSSSTSTISNQVYAHNNTQTSPYPTKSSFLYSGKRSLTNAREYLRKYQVIDQTLPYGLVKNIIPIKRTENIIEKDIEKNTEDLYEEIEFVLRNVE